jgi:hypothetical protein
VGCNFSVTAVTMDDVGYQNRLSWWGWVRGASPWEASSDWSGSVRLRTRMTWRSPCFATSCWCCAGRSPGPVTRPPIASCSRRWRDLSRGSAGRCSWSPRRPSSAGIGSWCAAAGPTRALADAICAPWTRRSSGSWSGWPRRTRGGVTCGSSASAASWASRCPRRRCASFCAPTGWAPRRGAAGRDGVSSCALRRRGRSRVTS